MMFKYEFTRGRSPMIGFLHNKSIKGEGIYGSRAIYVNHRKENQSLSRKTDLNIIDPYVFYYVKRSHKHYGYKTHEWFVFTVHEGEIYCMLYSDLIGFGEDELKFIPYFEKVENKEVTVYDVMCLYNL